MFKLSKYRSDSYMPFRKLIFVFWRLGLIKHGLSRLNASRFVNSRIDRDG